MGQVNSTLHLAIVNIKGGAVVSSVVSQQEGAGFRHGDKPRRFCMEFVCFLWELQSPLKKVQITQK